MKLIIFGIYIGLLPIVIYELNRMPQHITWWPFFKSFKEFPIRVIIVIHPFIFILMMMIGVAGHD